MKKPGCHFAAIRMSPYHTIRVKSRFDFDPFVPDETGPRMLKFVAFSDLD
jgi:hypothetical protein